MCLFEECNEPEVIYKHSDHWLKHMRQHTLRWYCNAKSHGVQKFDDQLDYEDHMRESHEGAFTESQLPLLVKQSARTTGPMFQSCPFCGEDHALNMGCLDDHIVGHLRHLALKSLPPAEDDLSEKLNGGTGDSICSPRGATSTIRKDSERRIQPDYEDSIESEDSSTEIVHQSTGTRDSDWGFVLGAPRAPPYNGELEDFVEVESQGDAKINEAEAARFASSPILEPEDRSTTSMMQEVNKITEKKDFLLDEKRRQSFEKKHPDGVTDFSERTPSHCCVIIQWDRVYQDGRREPQEEYHSCPRRFDPGHSKFVQIRTLADEYVLSSPHSEIAAGIAEYPIIEPNTPNEASAEQREERSNGKKKRVGVTKNDGSKLGFRLHIPFAGKSPKSKKEPKTGLPVIRAVDSPHQSSRPTVTYSRPEQFATGPYQPYEQLRRQSFDRRYDYTAYPAEPGRPGETHRPMQDSPELAVLPSRSTERRSRSEERGRRETLTLSSPELGFVERPPTAIVVAKAPEYSLQPVFREYNSKTQSSISPTHSQSHERPTSRTPTPLRRNHSPPRRNHSPRRLRGIEEDIRRIEDDLRTARRQARPKDRRSREQYLARVERDLQRLYDQQDAELELKQQLKVLRDDRAAFTVGRRERIPRDRGASASHNTRNRYDFEEGGRIVVNRAITNRIEERESCNRRDERHDNRAVERRDDRRDLSPASQTLRREEGREERRVARRVARREELRMERQDERRDERIESSNSNALDARRRVQRRSTIVGNDSVIWDDDRERRRRRLL